MILSSSRAILREACILSPFKSSDGLRISTMSRHTLNDGVTPDLRLHGQFQGWMPELSPGGRLVGSWYRGEVTWEHFGNEYRERLRTKEARICINNIIAWVERGTSVTLLCIEEDAAKCHRSILLEEIGRQSAPYWKRFTK